MNVSDTLAFHRTNQNNQIEALVSSLHVQNKILNWKLYQLITTLDNLVKDSFLKRRKQLCLAYKESYFAIVFVLVITISLLIGMFFIIRSDVYKDKKYVKNEVGNSRK